MHKDTKIEAEKVGVSWLIRVSNKGYTPEQIAKKYHIHPGTIKAHLSRKDSKHFNEWLQNRIYLHMLGLSGTNIVVFKRDGELCWAKCVMETCGIGSGGANSRLHDWQNKYIDIDDLFRPYPNAPYEHKEKKSINTPMWAGLSNKNRDHNLSKLKGPGVWEEKQPEPDGFTSLGSTHSTGQSGKVSYLRGD